MDGVILGFMDYCSVNSYFWEYCELGVNFGRGVFVLGLYYATCFDQV